MKRAVIITALVAMAPQGYAGTIANLPGGPAWPSGVGQVYMPNGYDAWKSWMGYDVDVMTVWVEMADTWTQIATGKSTSGTYLTQAMQQLPKTTPIVVSYPMAPASHSNRNCANPGMWDQFAAGSFDSHWQQMAVNFKALAQSYGRDPANHVIRLGWEMNGDWYPWSICNKVEQFKTSWQRVVGIIRAQIPGIMFDFSVSSPYVGFTAGRNYGGGPGVNLAAFLPNSSTYDVVSISVHDGFPDTVDDATWVRSNYNPPQGERKIGLVELVNTAKAVGKKIALSEWAAQMADCDSTWDTSPKPELVIAKVYEFLTANASMVAWETHFSPSCTALYSRSTTQAAQTYKSLWGSGVGGGSLTLGTGEPRRPQLVEVD